ncbi:PIN2/TERF1-interacting telomerase inhibitor 1-like [Liolophura sinensis]|uniref:PIN2/TERF1-interacting telomerase inhibitor 1-like n=1 Tax=Liolophura sinensis TaxID=3198878 RepID=UPI00315855B6
MAMLAAPRRKQKFSIDPRGSSWSKDETKFGQKMLEKMGWSKGRGLGVNEDGRTEHVKISLKDDTRGVGCSKSLADNWISHQDDFNSLLASLNQNGMNTEPDAVDNAKVWSLEAKSKSSKGRLHYQKFTRGKDLSSRKLEDLDCIFGRRKNKALKEKTKSVVEENLTSLPESVDSPAEQYGVQTFESTDSIQGYFARKMAKLDSSKRTNIEVNGAGGKDNEVKAQEQGSENLGLGIKTYSSSQSVQDYFAQKMAKLKKERLSSDVKASDASCESVVPLTEEPGDKPVKRQKKKKKRKQSCDEKSGEPVEKKKERKITVDSEGTLHKLSCETLTKESDVESNKKRKKDKKKREIDSDVSTNIFLDTKNKKVVSNKNLNHMPQELSAPVKRDMDSRKRIRFRDPLSSALGETTLQGSIETFTDEITKAEDPEEKIGTSETMVVVKTPQVMNTEEHSEIGAHSPKKKRSKKKAKHKDVSEQIHMSEKVDRSNIPAPEENSKGSAFQEDCVNNTENSKNGDKANASKKRKKKKEKRTSEARERLMKKRKYILDCGKFKIIETGFTGSNLDQIPGYSNSSLLLKTS